MRERAQAEGRAFVYDGRCRDLPSEESSVGSPPASRTPCVSASNPAASPSFRTSSAANADSKTTARRLCHPAERRLAHLSPHRRRRRPHHGHYARHPRRRSSLQYAASDPPLRSARLGTARLCPPAAHSGHRPRALSKRHGATSVMQFADGGFLPEAMFNFLALLGWSLDAETEVMSRETLIANFSLDRINRSAAVFDRKTGMDERRLPAHTGPGEGCRTHPPPPARHGVDAAELEPARLESLVALEIERSRTLAEMEDNLAYFFVTSLPPTKRRRQASTSSRKARPNCSEQLEGVLADVISPPRRWKPPARLCRIRPRVRQNRPSAPSRAHRPLRLARHLRRHDGLGARAMPERAARRAPLDRKPRHAPTPEERP
jgi:hypothetical protein